MKEDPALKNLIFFSNPIPEMEEDEDELDTIVHAEFACDSTMILDRMDEEDFKYVYQNAIITVRNENINEQIDFCYSIIEKINEVYDFTFMRKIDIDEQDVELIYKFLEFIEYDNLDFLEDLLDGMVVDVRKIEPREFVLSNWKEIENHILTIELGEFISDFLRTNTKENIVTFLTRGIEKSRMELTRRLLLK